jgi:Co/Zn/Cd efflux system component
VSAQRQLDLDELQRGHHDHDHDHDHGDRDHSHGLVDRSVLRSRAGVRAVALSLLILGLTAGAQVAVFVFANSVALLADLIHNAGDALTAIPLGIAFFLRSVRGEKIAGLAVVSAIFVSAMVALYETIMRFIHPEQITHLWALAARGVPNSVRCAKDQSFAGRTDVTYPARASRRARCEARRWRR